MIYVYKDRIINIEWTVLKGTSNVKENFDRALVKLFLIGPHEKFLLKANAKDGVVSAEVPQGLPEGVYSVEIIYIKNWLGVDRPPKMPDRFPIDCRGNDRCIMRSRKDNLFAITEYESEATEIGEGEVVIRVKTSTASYGYDGLSAYEIAVLRGDFEGTEGEWLEWTHERIVSDVRDLLQKLKDRDTRFVVKTREERDKIDGLQEGEEVYVIDDGISYILEMENGNRTWKRCDYGTVTAKYVLSLIASLPGFVADRAIADEFGKRIVDEYLTRDAVRNYMSEVFNDLFVNNPPTIMDGMITVDMLSDAVKQLIGFGPIVNFPDDEFLTTKGGRITPKDKNYDPNNYSGMGRRLLRKNMVNGVNVLTQKMMPCPNTIYVITYDYSLRGQTITVPENCVLLFEGGSLKNGTIVGNYTNIIASSVKLFDNIVISGTWKVQNIVDTWFNFSSSPSVDNIDNFNNLSAMSSDCCVNDIVINGSYCTSLKNGSVIQLTSNTNLILKGKISLLPNNLTSYSILSGINKQNISITGGGQLIGDLENHIGNTGEWGFGIGLIGCSNVSVSNIESSYMWGDGIYIGASDDTNEETISNNVQITKCKCIYNRRQGISVTGAINVLIENCYFSNTGRIKGANPKAGIDLEPNGLYNKNVIVRDCIANSNASVGFLIYGDNRRIILDNCTSNNQLISISVAQRIIEQGSNIIIRNGYIGGSLQITRGNIKVEDCEIDSVYFVSDTSELGADVIIRNTTLGAKRMEGSTFFNSVFLLAPGSQINSLNVLNSKIEYDPTVLIRGVINIEGNSIRNNILFEDCDISQKNAVNSLETKAGSYRNCRFYNMTRIYLSNEPNKSVEFVNNYCSMTKQSSSPNIFSILNSKNSQSEPLFIIRGNTFSTIGRLNQDSLGLIDVSIINLDNYMIFENNNFQTQYPLTTEQILNRLGQYITIAINYNFTSRFPYRADLSKLPSYNAFDAGALIYGDNSFLYFWNGENLVNSDGTDTRKVAIL